MNSIDTKEAKKFFEDHEEEMVDFIKKLVAKPSISESGDEYHIAKMVEEKCQEYNLPLTIIGDAEQVVAISNIGSAPKRLLLNCPLDTPSPGDITKWNHPPYSGITEDGKLYGLGTADCKTGLTTMLYTAFALKKLNNDEDYAISLAFDGGEQNGSFHGMRTLLKEKSNFEAALVGYAHRDPAIAIGARGYHRYQINTHGRPAHTGSRFDMGVNAISKMVRVVDGINKIQLLDKKSDDRFFFGPRLTISAISGGEAINIVPDECSILLDVRLVPGQDKETIDDALQGLFQKLRNQDPELDLTVEYIVGEDAYALPEDYPFTKVLLETVRKHFLVPYDTIANGPSHVGNLLYQYRIPTLVFGPRGDNCHNHDEYIELDSIIPTALTYYETALRFNEES